MLLSETKQNTLNIPGFYTSWWGLERWNISRRKKGCCLTFILESSQTCPGRCPCLKSRSQCQLSFPYQTQFQFMPLISIPKHHWPQSNHHHLLSEFLLYFQSEPLSIKHILTGFSFQQHQHFQRLQLFPTKASEPVRPVSFKTPPSNMYVAGQGRQNTDTSFAQYPKRPI